MAHATSLFPNSLFDNQSDISIFNILQTFEKKNFVGMPEL